MRLTGLTLFVALVFEPFRLRNRLQLEFAICTYNDGDVTTIDELSEQ